MKKIVAIAMGIAVAFSVMGCSYEPTVTYDGVTYTAEEWSQLLYDASEYNAEEAIMLYQLEVCNELFDIDND